MGYVGIDDAAIEKLKLDGIIHCLTLQSIPAG